MKIRIVGDEYWGCSLAADPPEECDGNIRRILRVKIGQCRGGKRRHRQRQAKSPDAVHLLPPTIGPCTGLSYPRNRTCGVGSMIRDVDCDIVMPELIPCPDTNDLIETLPLVMKYGRTDEIKALFQRDVDVNEKTASGTNAVMWAAQWDDEMLKLLLEKGADIKARDKTGATALILAAGEGNDHAVKLLLKKGADADARDNEGLTALMRASKKGHKWIAKFLKAHGAKQ